MLRQLPVLAVNRDEVFGLGEVEHQFQLFLAGMSGDMDGRAGGVFVDHIGAALGEMIQHAEDRFLVAGIIREESTTVSSGSMTACL